jgi:rSAM/selenodomain-associated transferase 2
VSIIIPTLNEQEYLGRLLEILCAIEDRRLLEIYVCDAGSTDQTRKIAGQYDVQWLNVNRPSRAVQMNHAAKMSLGDVLYFLHADTLPPKGFLDDIESAKRNNADLGGYSFRFNSDRKILRLNSWFTRFNKLSFRGGDQSLFITRTAWDMLVGYDEKFVIMEEYELLRRAKKLELRFHLMNGVMLVSDRKYHKNSYIRVNVANILAFSMFRMGCAPDSIRKKYHSMINHPKDMQ